MNKPIEATVSTGFGATFIRAMFPVNHSRFYLVDSDTERSACPEPGTVMDHNAGIMRTMRGSNTSDHRLAN